MLQLHNLMQNLARNRPVFHSEADFQHALAWEVHLQFPDALIRMERPVPSTLGVLYVDITVQVADQTFAFELKYKTRAAAVKIAGESFVLQDHGAQPLGRYDVLKDVTRLESLVEKSANIRGEVIFLTNDSAYWSEPRSTTDTSVAFSLHDGRLFSGRLEWAAKASEGTKRKREDALELRGEYGLRWREYSKIKSGDYSQFRYLVIEVGAPEAAA